MEPLIVGLVCGSVAICVISVCIGLFSGSDVDNDKDHKTALPSNFERLVEWLRERRRIIAEERIKLAQVQTETENHGAILRARITLLEERLQHVRDIHEKCASDCPTCKALKA